MSEISNVRQQNNHHNDDIKLVTSNLEDIGISEPKKESFDTILWGDNYRIKLVINNKALNANTCKNIRCFHCHHLPIEGSLMLSVPFKFVPSFIDQQVYSPDCINLTNKINVSSDIDPDMISKKSKGTIKINYFKKDLNKKEIENTSNIEKCDYYDCCDLVCSFNCCMSRGNYLSLIDPRFKNYKYYIYMMYKDIFGSYPVQDIEPAPEFFVTKEYGGNKTIEEIRKNYQYIRYDNTHQYVKASTIMKTNCPLNNIRDLVEEKYEKKIMMNQL